VLSGDGTAEGTGDDTTEEPRGTESVCLVYCMCVCVCVCVCAGVWLTNHRPEVLVSALVEQCLRHLVVTLLGGDVERSVEVIGGTVGRGAVLQQQYHVVNVTETSGHVQRTLLLLHTYTPSISYQHHSP